jgi:isopenicillin N synthase-like dioxygenase
MYGKEKPDLKESFIFGPDLSPADPDVAAGQPLMGPNRWPPALPEMQPVLERYFAELLRCGRQLLQGFAAALDLAPGFFAERFAKPLARGAIIHYPPQAPAREDERFGVAPHSDYGCLTLLWQDANGGLEVRNRAGAWIAAPPVADSFVVNIGDLMARWTNELYASTPHRVINRSGRERYSMPVFIDPHPETEVAALASCRRAGAAPRYPAIRCGAYIKERFDEAFRYRKG